MKDMLSTYGMLPIFFLSHDLAMFNCISSLFSTLSTKMKILNKYKISKFHEKKLYLNLGWSKYVYIGNNKV